MTLPLILSLDALFARVARAILTARSAHADATQQLAAATGRPQASLHWEACDYDTMKREAQHFANLVVAAAIKHFSRPGLTVDIDRGRYLEPLAEAERAIRDEWDRAEIDVAFADIQNRITDSWATFSPLSLWQAIERDHPPESVIKESARRAADLIRREFELDRHPTMRIVGGAVELQSPLWTQRARGASLGRYTVQSGGMQRLRTLWAAFQTFADQVLPASAAAALSEGERALREIDQRGFLSRERVAMGGGLHLVLYKSAMKLYVPAALAQQLNTYLAAHTTTLAA